MLWEVISYAGDNDGCEKEYIGLTRVLYGDKEDRLYNGKKGYGRDKG